jgi:hypothetical protein
MHRALFLFVFISLIAFWGQAQAASDTIHVELGVYHCDNDSICEVAENAEFCPLDCTATTTEEEPEEDNPPRPSSRPRLIQQFVDLFQTYIPFTGESVGSFVGPTDESGYVCNGDFCTAFTDDFARSVIVSFEESFGGSENGSVSIKPILGGEIVFEWEGDVSMRIMRSPKEFPVDPLSGELVYEGASGEFISSGVLGSDIMYYSLFPRRADGSYGDPEFVIIQSKGVLDEKNATSTLVKLGIGAVLAAILGFVGRFIFLLI